MRRKSWFIRTVAWAAFALLLPSTCSHTIIATRARSGLPDDGLWAYLLLALTALNLVLCSWVFFAWEHVCCSVRGMRRGCEESRRNRVAGCLFIMLVVSEGLLVLGLFLTWSMH